MSKKHQSKPPADKTPADTPDSPKSGSPKSASPKADVAALTPAQKTALTKKRMKAEADRLRKEEQVRLAQVANLMIAGMSFEEIGMGIGATADEVERMIMKDTQRYIRTQPALRQFVRNFANQKFTAMLAANLPDATDQNSPKKLENQDRVVRILDSMRKMNGADLPTQAEIKIETAPEAVEALVNALQAQKGLAYDDDVFDVDFEEEEEEEEEGQL